MKANPRGISAGGEGGAVVAGVDRLLLWVLRIYGLVAVVSLALAPRFFLPAEDAVILFQYSRNLAQHGAITFLAGGPHTEGATDFAWMLMVAGAMRCGVSPFWFCAVVNVLALVVLGVILLRLARVRVSVWRVLAIAGAAALFPQIMAAASGFAVLPDAALLALVVLFVVEGRVAGAAVSALGLCLFRPDGVVFAVPLLICMLLAKDGPEKGSDRSGRPVEEQERNTGVSPLRHAIIPRGSGRDDNFSNDLFTSSRGWRGRRVAAIGALYVIPGVLYFFWRWHYFGELFPLPFLVKSDAERVLGMFVGRSVRTSVVFLVFDGIMLVPFIQWREGWNRRLAFALIAVPTAFYWMMRLDQNVGYRFFYYLPVAAAILLAVNWQAVALRRRVVLRTALVAWLVLLALPLYREVRTFRDEQFVEVKEVAEALGRLPRRGTMITTEAGFLPYFSGWTTYDAWGLNTAEFAHRFFQPADVGRLNPDLVVLHPDRGESCVAEPGWQAGYKERTWPHLTRNLVLGADPSRYELWVMSYGSEFYRRRKGWKYGEGDRECWLLRRDSGLYGAMARVLEEHHAVAGR